MTLIVWIRQIFFPIVASDWVENPNICHFFVPTLMIVFKLRYDCTTAKSRFCSTTITMAPNRSANIINRIAPSNDFILSDSRPMINWDEKAPTWPQKLTLPVNTPRDFGGAKSMAMDQKGPKMLYRKKPETESPTTHVIALSALNAYHKARAVIR